MSASETSFSFSCDAAPTAKQRLTALHRHAWQFETIEEYPGAGVHERFLKQKAMVIAFLEGEVYDGDRKISAFLRDCVESKKEVVPNKKMKQLARLMRKQGRVLLSHHAMTNAFSDMMRKSEPPLLLMDVYRDRSQYWDGVSNRAANGELLSKYGEVGDPVPRRVAADDNGGLEFSDTIIFNWLISPACTYIVNPALKLWCSLPFGSKQDVYYEVKLTGVEIRTIQRVARILKAIIANVSLMAPTATLDSITSSGARKIAMASYAFFFSILALLLGAQSLPHYTLITSYYQAMNIADASSDSKVFSQC